jgi:hypothetical protein
MSEKEKKNQFLGIPIQMLAAAIENNECEKNIAK